MNHLKSSIKQKKHFLINEGLEAYLETITQNCEKELLFTKKRSKIENDGLNIPTIDNYKEFMNYNYNVNQLKIFAKFYKLKLSGNKNELVNRIFIYLKLSFFIIKIQKLFRGKLIRRFISIHGPANKNKNNFK
jgi:hypothetical protein